MSFVGVEASLVNNRLTQARSHQRRIRNLWTNRRLNPRLSSTSRTRRRKTRTISNVKIPVLTGVKIPGIRRRLKFLSELLWTSATDCSVCAGALSLSVVPWILPVLSIRICMPILWTRFLFHALQAPCVVCLTNFGLYHHLQYYRAL